MWETWNRRATHVGNQSRRVQCSLVRVQGGLLGLSFLWPLKLRELSDSPFQCWYNVLLCVSCSVTSDSAIHGLQPTSLLCPWNSSRRILEWVAFPFSRGSSRPRDWTQVSCIAGRFWYNRILGVAKSRTRLSDFTFTFHFHALEKEMATRSSVLAWRIPGTGEPRGLPSMGSHRVGHDWSALAAAAGCVILIKHWFLLTSSGTHLSSNSGLSHVYSAFNFSEHFCLESTLSS